MIDERRATPAAIGVIVAAAVAAVWRTTTGSYVGDNRFDQYWAPGWRLAREASLWDATRGMGRIGEELWPLTVPPAVLRGFGLSPVTTQQVWLVVVWTVAATGIVALLRTFQPRVGLTHVVAGLAYAFSPYAITFLLPTNLFWSFAIAPWLMTIARRGVASDRPWSWAAAWALLVWTGGDTDPPGLALSIAWVVPVVVFDVVVAKTVTPRRAVGWTGRAVVLTTWVHLATLVKVSLGSGPLAQRLLTTEGVEEVNQTSGWSESWRGLGYWLTYYGTPGRDGDVPGATGWYETLLGVLATFVVPVVALAALWRLRWRHRLLWGALAAVAVTVMVGTNDAAGRSPLGAAVLAVYDTVPSLTSFRTTYKAGAGLMIAIAVLAATGASAWGATLARRDPRLRPVPLAALGVLVAVTAVPVWSGRLHAEDRRMDAVAAHWIEATDWIEAQPGDARVLVLPGSTQTAYRWGWAGDDILDTLLRRHPNVTPTNFPVSSPLTADIVDAVARRLQTGRLTADELADISRRLGVGWVLVRNDLDWDRLRVPRPSAFDPIREGDALPLARAFGEPGTDTTDPEDTSRTAQREAELAPIEVFEVPGVDGAQQLARADVAPLVVDGGGDAWPVLASLGLLAGDRPLHVAGLRDGDHLTDLVDGAATVVVTDTNQRRLTLIRGPGPSSSGVLTADADPGPVAPADLLGREGSQTVATHGDAVHIAADTGGTSLRGFEPWFRPALAFDGDVGSSWRTGSQRDPVGDVLELGLAEPHPIEQIEIVPLATERRLRRITEVEVSLDGETRRVPLDGTAPAVVRWDEPVHAERIEVRITAVEGEGQAAVGLAEVRVAGVDARERLVLPTHLTGTDDPALRTALSEAPVAYALTRSGRVERGASTTFEEERTLRRRIGVVGDRTFALTGTLRGGVDLADRTIDALVPGEVGAWGSSRPVAPSEGRGGLAVDGDPTTAWVGAGRDGERLTVRFPTRDVATVTVRTAAGGGDVPLDRVLIDTGDVSIPVDLAPEPGCDTPSCDRIGSVEVAAGEQAELTVTAEVADGAGGGSRRVRILEVEVDGADGPLPTTSTTADPGCGSGVISIDDEPVRMRLVDDDVAALDRPAVAVEACDPVALGDGDHDVDSTAGARIETLVLATDDALPEATTPSVRAVTTARGPARMSVGLDGDDDTWVLTGQSFDPGWRATVDGRDLGAPVEVDGQAAWRVPAGPDRAVELVFGPQRTYRVALGLSLLGVVTCAGLIGRAALRRLERRRYAPDVTAR